MSPTTATLAGNGPAGYDEVALLRSEVEARFGRLGRSKNSLRPSSDPFAFEPLDQDPNRGETDGKAGSLHVALSERLDALLG